MNRPIQLCTDSSAQLPARLAEALCVEVVPVGIALDGEPVDETEVDVDLFYDRLREGARASTSQPSPGRLAEAYALAAERGAGEVLSLHVSAAVWGTVGSAELAALDAPIPVTVVDTRTVSFGVAACVIAAAAVLAAGGPVGDAVAAAERLAPTVRNAFVAGGAPGGRVPAAAGLPLLSFADSSTEMLGSAESIEHAAALIESHILSREGPIVAAVGHADRATAAAADALAVALEAQVAELIRYRVGPSVGAHTGGLSFGAFWWPAAW